MLDKLAKQTAIYGISTIVGRFLSYLLTPYYTRVFGLESYGVITDVYALIPFAFRQSAASSANSLDMIRESYAIATPLLCPFWEIM